eukprot:gene28068-36955_t
MVSVVLCFRFRGTSNLANLGRVYHTNWSDYKVASHLQLPTVPHHVNNRKPLFAVKSNVISSEPIPLKAIIAGAPASGKGTQCEFIRDKFNVVHLSTGDILRAAVKEGTAVGIRAKEFMDAGKLVPDEVIIDVVVERLKQDDCVTRGWLLDGFPRTKSQADALLAAGMVPDCFILLNVPEEVLVERVTGRRTDPVTGKIYHMKFSPPENEEIAARLVQRSDDTAEKIVVRFKEFQSHIDAVQSSFDENIIIVDGTARKNEVQGSIESALFEILQEKKAKKNAVIVPKPFKKVVDKSPLKIIIAGAPASGKGTQCEFIRDKFNVVHLSTGDILRAAVKEGTAVGIRAKEFMDAGKLVPDEVIIDVVVERLKQDDCVTRGWLLDGFPRTKSQADALLAAGMVPDCFILLNVPEEVLVERVTGRRTDPVTGKIYHMKFSPPENEEIAARLVQRSDDTAEKIVVRFKEFQSHIDAVQSSFEENLIVVDGTAKAKEISGVLSVELASIKTRKLEPEEDEGDDDDDLSGGKQLRSRSTVGSLQTAVNSGISQTALGMMLIISLDKFLSKFFIEKGIAFPSSLGGMVGLFAFLCASSKLSPVFTDNELFYRLSHAGALLKTWLPLFFVPPLVVLPLKVPLIAGFEFKLAVLTIVGAFFSLFSSGILSQQLLSSFATSKSPEDDVPTSVNNFSFPKARIPLAVSTICAGFMTVNPSTKSFLTIPFSISSTVAGFLLGMKSSPAVKAILHPVLFSAAYTALALGTLGLLTSQSFPSMLTAYYGSAVGAGDRISTLLGPAIICNGLQLFQYRGMLFRNLPAVLSTTLSAAVLGVLSSALLASIAMFSSAEMSLAPLTRCITSPLALAAAKLTGADPSVSALIVVLTGIIGASFGDSFLNWIGVRDPVAIGLSLGSSAHGLGMAAVASNPIKFASAVVAMTLTGLWTVAILSVPSFRNNLVKLSLSRTL